MLRNITYVSLGAPEGPHVTYVLKGSYYGPFGPSS